MNGSLTSVGPSGARAGTGTVSSGWVLYLISPWCRPGNRLCAHIGARQRRERGSVICACVVLLSGKERERGARARHANLGPMVLAGDSGEDARTSPS